MQCPKCQAKMEKVTTPRGVVDRCTSCRGLWFDAEEHEELREFAENIDTGDPEKGAEQDKIDRIACPVCPNSRMIRMVDPGQPHIRFESCPTCYGRYYDAGEFRDFATHDLGDLIKSLFAEERK